ncbi:MAG: F0F1 ATP synthase subunit gamma [Lachnospiraceae bacterium]|nr:F0F1 ATP synthase subunit gamma [Lachnospiraceae bacterium]
MRIKPIVKVMNFHALIRVDKARKKAEKYLKLEREASDIIDLIANNRNFQLDKKLWSIDETKPPLNIYIGSDFGFCGNINFTVNQYIERDIEADKILVGRKLRQSAPGVVLALPREEFYSDYDKIHEFLVETIMGKQHSQINLIYNHFYNMSRIEITKKKIFPFDIEVGTKVYTEDFFVEGDANRILYDLLTSYVNYEVKIAEVNSYASENIYRQNSTSESLKKIEEIEAEQLIQLRKERVAKEFEKVIDNFTKKMAKAGGR